MAEKSTIDNRNSNESTTFLEEAYRLAYQEDAQYQLHRSPIHNPNPKPSPFKILCSGLVFTIMISLIISMLFGLYFLITTFAAHALAIGFGIYFLIWIIASLSTRVYNKCRNSTTANTRSIALRNNSSVRCEPGVPPELKFVNETTQNCPAISLASISQISQQSHKSEAKPRHMQIKLPSSYSLSSYKLRELDAAATTPQSYQQHHELKPCAPTTCLKSMQTLGNETLKNDGEYLPGTCYDDFELEENCETIFKRHKSIA